MSRPQAVHGHTGKTGLAHNNVGYDSDADACAAMWCAVIERIVRDAQTIADAVSKRDEAINKAYDSGNEKRIAWADSELELRKNGNDVLNELGAPLRAIAEWIAKIETQP